MNFLGDCFRCTKPIDLDMNYVFCPNKNLYCGWNCREIEDNMNGATEIGEGEKWIRDRIWLKNNPLEIIG